jgi:hypothetical protein
VCLSGMSVPVWLCAFCAMRCAMSRQTKRFYSNITPAPPSLKSSNQAVSASAAAPIAPRRVSLKGVPLGSTRFT